MTPAPSSTTCFNREQTPFFKRDYQILFGDSRRKLIQRWSWRAISDLLFSPGALGELRGKKRDEKYLRDDLAGAEDDDGFAVGGDQAVFLERFHDASGHFARAADDLGDLLARDLDLHTVGMGNRIGFARQVQ